MTCKHMNFAANVAVNRIEDTGRFMADVTVKCIDCGEPFQFIGLEPGLKMNGATVSIDGLEARMAILPNSQAMSPLERMTATKQ
ncbi:hypothetical protein EN742_06495 [Mesorhizobium sp. M4A.F.Ca.ET.020.02.1.1]|uniref:hypothetical protein n=1 Tax=Mesorhizobium sp. M4A.F.Ca.ET.020.02.1.1 TaxID=2496652 RepID=UPI000FD33FFC|nr:hypothetical protein [Mesorhizobium sp. M4A.F.Ca.ET.020.02.1.1]RVD42861.1 hypothetical protein EN742_06495 [Mesorhizobium sp. M4A.F.Ca.ET.020.02.1.1]